MFTGIIQDQGELIASEAVGGDVRLSIRCPRLDLAEVAEGDSIAVSGVCLTALNIDADRFAADVSRETLDLTRLGRLSVGDRVNLELALTATSRLGGHLMTGHVDGLARVLERRPDARSQRFVFEVPAELARFIAPKGSVGLDGVSLTVNDVSGTRFGVNLIPHTLAMTTLNDLAPGDAVNLEVDLLARYVARLAECDRGQGMTRGFLEDHGFA